MNLRKLVAVIVLLLVVIVVINVIGFLMYGSELEKLAREIVLSWYRRSLPSNITVIEHNGGYLFIALPRSSKVNNVIFATVVVHNVADKPFEFICEHERFNVSGRSIEGTWIDVLPWNLTIELSNGTSIRCCSSLEGWSKRCLCRYEPVTVYPLMNRSIVFKELPIEPDTAEGIIITRICNLLPRKAIVLELIVELEKSIANIVERICIEDACMEVSS